jgi:ribosomal protein L22
MEAKVGSSMIQHSSHIFKQQPASLRPLLSLQLSNRTFSTVVAKDGKQPTSILSPTSPTLITDDESGKQFGVLLDTRNLPKLKPSIVQRRLAQCKTYEGRERNIRQSPWKLNRICQLAAGLTLEEALTQLKFCDLKNADLVAKVLKRTSNLADIRDGLQISQLEVAQCFTTNSAMLRRIKPMGRGRYVIF